MMNRDKNGSTSKSNSSKLHEINVTTGEEFRAAFGYAMQRAASKENWSNWTGKVQLDFEVKKIKKVLGVLNDNFHWIELIAPDGSDGWLYSSLVNFFAFETDSCWILVDKTRLIQLVNDKCKAGSFSEQGKIEPYKLYNRKNSLELLWLLPSTHLMAVSFLVIPKK